MSNEQPPAPVQPQPPLPPQYGQQPPLQYSDQQAPFSQQYGQPPLKPPTEPLAIWGLVLAFLFWPAGLVLSILGSRKIKRTGGQGAGLALGGLIVSIVIGAISIVSGIVLALAAASTIAAVDDISDSLPTSGSVEAPVAPDATPDAGTPGSRTAPLAYGDVIDFANDEGAIEWQSAVGAPNWDATAVVGANDFNDPAPAGSVYVIVPVTFVNKTTEGKSPWLEGTVKFVSADGRSFDPMYASIENDVSDLADLYQDGQVTGNVLFALPTDSLVGGTWAVSYSWFDGETFVAAV